jgi:hypothetical protein
MPQRLHRRKSDTQWQSLHLRKNQSLTTQSQQHQKHSLNLNDLKALTKLKILDIAVFSYGGELSLYVRELCTTIKNAANSTHQQKNKRTYSRYDAAAIS